MDKRILKAQEEEITEFFIYSFLASRVKEKENKEILLNLAKEEKRHYEVLKKISNQEVLPNKLKIYFYSFISFIFGIVFTLRLMERGEKTAIGVYSELGKEYPELKKILEEEKKHEGSLIDMLKEEKVEYAGAVVLGLNDALVELTGALVGLTFAIQNPSIVGLSGLIVGIAASLSMAVSSYLSSKEEREINKEKNPLRAAIYTGIAYLSTVIVLVSPYFFIANNIYLSLALTLLFGVGVVAFYTFYITTAKDQKFFPKFFEMIALSGIVSLISLASGTILRTYFGIEEV